MSQRGEQVRDERVWQLCRHQRRFAYARREVIRQRRNSLHQLAQGLCLMTVSQEALRAESYSPPCTINAQAIRALLLATATAAMFCPRRTASARAQR